MLNQEFNTWLHDYNERIRRWVPHYNQLVDSIAHLSATIDPKDILDLGCGNGNITHALVEHYPNAHYHLVDASSDMIGAVRQRFNHVDEITFSEKYFQNLRLHPSSFDVIAAGLSLHHLSSEEKPALLAKIYEWLRPGGIFTYGDLFASKRNPNYKQEVLGSWEKLAKANGTSDESWATLMEHHSEYDWPDLAEDQMQWLKDIGFVEMEYQHVGWYTGVIQCRKPMAS